MRSEEGPLFSRTANWTRVWDNSKTDHMLVLVNGATLEVMSCPWKHEWLKCFYKL